MKRSIFLFIFLVFLLPVVSFTQAQNILSGRITSDYDQKPLAAVSVYLSNTSIGVYTSQNGTFSMEIPEGKYKLVVSYVGFLTYTKVIDSRNLPSSLNIQLKPKPDELPEIVLEPWVINGWLKWGTVFKDLLIGTSSISRDCDLINPDSIRFRYSKKTNTLTAVAFQPLIIRNYTLGYEIQYSMEDFELNLNTYIVKYDGYPFFKDLSLSKPSKSKKYAEERIKVYNGSLMHFMRSIFEDKSTEEGFVIRSLGLVPNHNKELAKIKFQNAKDSLLITRKKIFIRDNDELVPYTNVTDSTAYYKYFLQQPDRIISREIIPSSQLRFPVDSLSVAFYSSDSLEVSYLKKDLPQEYKKLNSKVKLANYPVSRFVFINDQPITVLKNGNYSQNQLRITGFWAWWETLSTMLPLDYKP